MIRAPSRFRFQTDFQVWFVAALCLFMSGYLQDSVRRIGAGATALVAPPPQYIGISIDPRIVRRFLGVRLVVADLIWIDTLIKSDINREAEAFTSVYRAFKVITTLDPDNLLAYYVAGMYLSVIKDDIKGASAILHEGVEWMDTHRYVWKNAWRIPFSLGYNLIYEEQNVEEGGGFIRKAAELPNAPDIAKALARRVSTEQGRLEIAARVLNDVYERASRPEERQRIEAKMINVGVRRELLELNERFQEFLATTKANAFPRRRQFELFLRFINHSGRDMTGGAVYLNAMGKIASRSIESAK